MVVGGGAVHRVWWAGMGRAIGADDLLRLRWLDTPQLSADGAAIAYVEGGLDRGRDALVSRVYRVAADGGAAVCLTPDGAFDEQPRWSPGTPAEGGTRRLALVSDREGERRLWVVEGAGARPLITGLAGVTGPAWSPDGGRLAFVALDGGRQHIWTVPVEGGAPLRLTEGEWDDGNPIWSPAGESIAFHSDRSADRGENPASDIWIIPAAGGAARCLTRGTGPIRALAWSPDGRSIAFIGHDRGNDQAANLGVWVVGLAGEPPRLLTGGLDRSVGLVVRADTPAGSATPDLAWIEHDGDERIYYCFADRGRSWIGWADLAGRTGVVAGGERAVLAFAANAAAKRLAFVVSAATEPGALCTADLAGGDERRILAPNDDWLPEIALSKPEYRPFRADDGELVDAWLMRPAATPDAGPPPLILEIHGGPHYPIGERFYFEFQRLAAQGYAVLYVNPRGSQGYGEHFASAVRGAWGERDAADLLQALDAALAAGAGDPRRLGLTGVSYGAYMTHLLLTRSDRFVAAVSENGISDLPNSYDYHDRGNNGAARAFWAWEMDGTPQTEPDRFRERSPLTHADRIADPATPHPRRAGYELRDCAERGPLRRARGAWGAVRLGRVPEEGHLMNLIGRPSHRLLRTAWLDGWFARYLHPAHPPAGAIDALALLSTRPTSSPQLVQEER